MSPILATFLGVSATLVVTIAIQLIVASRAAGKIEGASAVRAEAQEATNKRVDQDQRDQWTKINGHTDDIADLDVRVSVLEAKKSAKAGG